MGWSRFLRRSRWDDERAREIEAHLAHETDAQIARGLSPADARAAALRKFGNPARVREQIYDMNTIGWVEAARLDLGDALRQVRRHRASTAVTALLLTIGIGASAAAFTIVHGVLLRPVSYPESARLVTLWQEYQGRQEQVSYPDLSDLRSLPVFDNVAAIGSGIATLMRGVDVDRVTLVEGEPALLALLGARAPLGGFASAADAGAPVGAISRRLWRRVFHESPGALGQSIELSGRRITIVGVVGDLEFELPVGAAAIGAAFTIKDVDLWQTFDPKQFLAGRRSISNFEAVATLARGVTLAQAQSAVDTAAANLARQYPATNRDRGFRLVPLQQQMVRSRATAIWMAFAGALLMLVVACVNAAGLTLGELPTRRRDFALREALGAGRARLLRQVAWESALIAAVSALAGLALGSATVTGFVHAVELPRAAGIRVNGAVVAFGTATAFVCAMLVRLAPLARLEGGAGGLREWTSLQATSAPRLRRALVTMQIAIALLLCGAAALLGASFRAVLRVEPGFDPSHALSARVSAYERSYPSKPSVIRFVRDLTSKLRDDPEVGAAGASTSVPLVGSSSGSAVMYEGDPVAEADRVSAGWQAVTPGFFEATGIPIRTGRDFDEADLSRTAHHVIVNETLARRLFGTGDPIGKRLLIGPDQTQPDWHEIVGVVGDTRHLRLTDAPEPRVYDLFGEHWARTLYVVVRGRQDGNSLAPLIRRTVRAIDPGVPVFQVRSLDDLVDAARADRRTVAALSVAVGGVSLLLAGIGIYGLLAGLVSGRLRELGIRRALGASTLRLTALVTREVAAMATAGVAAGALAILMVARVIQAQLYGVTATDGRILASVAALLVAVAVAAALPPARRAASVDPAVTLRAE